MNDLNDRSLTVRSRLETMLLGEIPACTSVVPADEWAVMAATGGPWMFGFAWPIEFEDTALVAYSPDVIAGTTAWMEDEAFDTYMDIIEFMLGCHIADLMQHPERPVEERRQQVENELWKIRTEAMEFLSHVQMQILDMIQEYKPHGDDNR